MSKYDEMKKTVEEKVKGTVRASGKHPVSSSTTDLVGLAQALMNSPEYVQNEYKKSSVDANGEPVATETKPATRYRESLKPTLKQLGLDKEEVNQIDTVTFSKEQASAVMEVAGTVIKDYIKAGRKYVFPITDKEETQMAISVTDVAEKKTAIKKFETQPDGKSIPVDTGRVMKTKKHSALKVSNAVPPWLKEEL